MEDISRRTILSALGSDFYQFSFLPLIGASDGILIAWRRHLGVTGQKRIDNYCISIQFCNANNRNWWLTCVYGPQRNGDKIQFLQELREIRVASLG
jgi:hypothetical protein